MQEKETDKELLSENALKIVVLITFMEEMASEDGFGTLAGTTRIHPKIADVCARYSAAEMRGIERYQKR
jgi:hypothetical protein